MIRLTICAALAPFALTHAASAQTAYPAPPALTGEAAAVQKIIWAKEMAIYEGRAHGDVSYYVNNTSPNYVAWTAGTPTPFRIDKLKASGGVMKGKDKEIITTTFRDFSLSGDTAIIFYQNHRARMPDGTDVDQTYDNIHVWQKRAGDWKVLASMSRQMPASPAAPAK